MLKILLIFSFFHSIFNTIYKYRVYKSSNSTCWKPCPVGILEIQKELDKFEIKGQFNSSITFKSAINKKDSSTIIDGTSYFITEHGSPDFLIFSTLKGKGISSCDFTLKRYISLGNGEIDSLYDLNIELRPIHQLKLFGWEITFNNKSEYLSSIKDDRGRLIISTAGGYNKGKTHILSKILNLNLPKGFNMHTEGLSVKLLNDALIIDTPGRENPINWFGNNLFSFIDNEQVTIDQQIKDKLIMDQLMEDFLVDVSNVFILVVNQLTLTDQILVNNYIKKYERALKENQEHKQLVIIHNYYTLNHYNDIIKQI